MTDTRAIPALAANLPPRSKTLVCSLARGKSHIACMRWMAPTARYYADRHGMDHFLLPLYHDGLGPGRPAAWDKIILLNHMLKTYETVIWLDVDTIVVDPETNILDGLDPSVPMHVVAHRIGRKTIPNTGVWVCRRDPRTFELLKKLWNHTEFIHDGWWEQAALMDLIGYEPRGRRCRFREITRFTSYVHFMEQRWNSRYADPAAETAIMHFTGPYKPLDVMESMYKEFLVRTVVTRQ